MPRAQKPAPGRYRSGRSPSTRPSSRRVSPTTSPRPPADRLGGPLAGRGSLRVESRGRRDELDARPRPGGPVMWRRRCSDKRGQQTSFLLAKLPIPGGLKGRGRFREPRRSKHCRAQRARSAQRAAGPEPPEGFLCLDLPLNSVSEHCRSNGAAFYWPREGSARRALVLTFGRISRLASRFTPRSLGSRFCLRSNLAARGSFHSPLARSETLPSVASRGPRVVSLPARSSEALRASLASPSRS